MATAKGARPSKAGQFSAELIVGDRSFSAGACVMACPAAIAVSAAITKHATSTRTGSSPPIFLAVYHERRTLPPGSGSISARPAQ